MINSFVTADTTPKIEFLVYNVDTDSLEWSFAYECRDGGNTSISCNPADSSLYLSQESQMVVIGINHDNYPSFFQVHFDNGTISGSVHLSSSQYTSVQAPFMSQYASSDSEVIIYYPITNGHVALIWSISNSTIIETYEKTIGGTSMTAITGSRGNNMMYFASGSLTPLQIYKFYYYDSDQRNVVLEGTASFTTTTLYDYSSTVKTINSLGSSSII